jgi:hypothetical protein
MEAENLKSEAQTKRCPKCLEEINASAKICKHCKADLRNWFARHKILTVIILFFSLISALTKSAIEKADVQKAASDRIKQQQLLADEKTKQDPQWQKTKAGQVCVKNPSWSKDDCEKVSQKLYWIGMSYDMLITSFGRKPDHANPSNYGGKTKWQYCWNSITPSCYYDNNNDGIIESFN